MTYVHNQYCYKFHFRLLHNKFFPQSITNFSLSSPLTFVTSIFAHYDLDSCQRSFLQSMTNKYFNANLTFVTSIFANYDLDSCQRSFFFLQSMTNIALFIDLCSHYCYKFHLRLLRNKFFACQ